MQLVEVLCLVQRDVADRRAGAMQLVEVLVGRGHAPPCPCRFRSSPAAWASSAVAPSGPSPIKSGSRRMIRQAASRRSSETSNRSRPHHAAPSRIAWHWRRSWHLHADHTLTTPGPTSARSGLSLLDSLPTRPYDTARSDRSGERVLRSSRWAVSSVPHQTEHPESPLMPRGAAESPSDDETPRHRRTGRLDAGRLPPRDQGGRPPDRGRGGRARRGHRPRRIRRPATG